MFKLYMLKERYFSLNRKINKFLNCIESVFVMFPQIKVSFNFKFKLVEN